MDIGGRETLIAIGVLLLIGILLDGFRRARDRGKGRIRSGPRRQPIFDDEIDDTADELSGEVRVVGVRDEQSAEKLSREIKEKAARNRSRLTGPYRKPEQEWLNFDNTAEQPADVAIDAGQDVIDKGDDVVETEGGALGVEDTPVAAEDSAQEGVDNSGVEAGAGHTDGSGVDIDAVEADKHAIDRQSAHVLQRHEAPGPRQKQPQQELAQDVIVVHLVAPPGEEFNGGDLLKMLLKSGLRYGPQKIFHRHEDEDGAGSVLFSMTNLVNPGIFELDSMADFNTPGISFFMVMQDCDDPMAAFELMLDTVSDIQEVLGGDLKDEQRSALTRQTAEHYREQIMDYNRRKLAG